MKKLFTLTLAILLTLALTTAALAASTVTDTTQNNTVTTEVYASVNHTNNTTPVYAVDITWDDLSFIYSYGSSWNPGDLSYNDSQLGSWQDANGSLTVSNRSNADVVATVLFTPTAGITHSFQNNKSTATLTDASVSGRATSETFVITVGGTPDLSGSTAKIGSITVTITKPN